MRRKTNHERERETNHTSLVREGNRAGVAVLGGEARVYEDDRSSAWEQDRICGAAKGKHRSDVPELLKRGGRYALDCGDSQRAGLFVYRGGQSGRSSGRIEGFKDCA